MGSRTERAHQKYREGQYEEALELYSDALNAAKLLQHKIALHSNRAACHLKLKSYRKVYIHCLLHFVLNLKIFLLNMYVARCPFLMLDVYFEREREIVDVLC